MTSVAAKRPIEPTSAWAADSSPNASTRYPFLHLSGLGRALQPELGQTMMGSRTNQDFK